MEGKTSRGAAPYTARSRPESPLSWTPSALRSAAPGLNRSGPDRPDTAQPPIARIDTDAAVDSVQPFQVTPSGLSRHASATAVATPAASPARAGGGRVGFISGTSDTYCGDCDRLRVASDGVLRPCLATNDGVEA
ncbi:MAG: hypothetical protein EOO74_03975, partial [Myxococcales bacterium]